MGAVAAWNSGVTNISFWVCDTDDDKPKDAGVGSQAFVLDTKGFWIYTGKDWTEVEKKPKKA